MLPFWFAQYMVAHNKTYADDAVCLLSTLVEAAGRMGFGAKGWHGPRPSYK